MGQYFIICNLDKKELVDPGEFGHGLKLFSIASSSNGALMGLTYLLALSGGSGGVEQRASDPMFGRWAGDRVAIVGDYFNGTVAGMAWDQGVWTEVSSWRDGWVDITEHVVRSIEAFFRVRVERGGLDDTGPRSVLHADGTVTPLGAPWWITDEPPEEGTR